MKKTTFFLASFMLLMIPLLSFAQSSDEQSGEAMGHGGELSMEEIDAIMSSYEESASQQEDVGNVNCFDYYKFYSVETSIAPEGEMLVAGSPIRFSGHILNKNTYPVVDGSLFVRISHVNDENVSQGNDIIDEFFAIEEISLDKESRKDVQFLWETSDNLPAGNYQADFFFVVGKKFNLSGLSFTNEVVAASTQFTVTSNAAQTVYFDRSSTKVNGVGYAHIGNVPTIDNGAKTSILQEIVNREPNPVEVEVEYSLYYWDSLHESNKIKETTESVVIDGNSKKELLYEIPETGRSVYYLQMTASKGGQKSIVNIRFAGSGNQVRLNYPGITKFPLQEGDSQSIFTCFHNTAYANTTGRVVVELFDKNEKKITSTEYTGQILSDMSAQAKEFSVQKEYDFVKLVSRAYDDKGAVIDQYEVIYDCKKLNSCKEKIVDFSRYGTWLYVASGILFVSVVVLVSVRAFKNRNN